MTDTNTAPKPARKPRAESTRETLRRLKEVLQTRIRQLEAELTAIGSEVNALSNERDIRSANTLVRTLEKVLELEHKERKRRSSRTTALARLNAAEREDLARRLAGLRAGERDAGPDAADRSDPQPAARLAPVGEGGPASA